MIRVGLVDDDQTHTQLLKGYLARYGQEGNVRFQVEEFSDGLSFVEGYSGDLDIVFLDIEMPHMDGMTAARTIRERDASLAIVFITNMAQYAVHGYEVDAIDFMVKPVGYFNFARKLKRALRFLSRRAQRTILLSDEDGVVRVTASDVWYVEKDRDYLVYHTSQGVFRKRGTMKAERAVFQGLPFEECTSGCLVNLDQAQRIGREHVYLKEVQLPLSLGVIRYGFDLIPMELLFVGTGGYATEHIAFGKTDLLQPGDSQTLTLTFTEESMASYDDQGRGCPSQLLPAQPVRGHRQRHL